MTSYDFFDSNPYGIHKRAVELVGRDKSVLEVGCATGQVSRRLVENGCKVIGVEINPDSAERAKEYCDDVIVSNIGAVECLPRDHFDFILLLDVLEHLQSPSDTLKKIKKNLKLGGFVIVSLPNIANWEIRWELLHGRFEYRERGILDRTHLRFFNEAGARKLLQEAGFDIVKFDIVPSVPLIRIRASLAYSISRLRPNIFARQFLIVASSR